MEDEVVPAGKIQSQPSLRIGTMLEVVTKIWSNNLGDFCNCATGRGNCELIQNDGMVQLVEKIEDMSELPSELEDLQVVEWYATGGHVIVVIVVGGDRGTRKFESPEGGIRCEYGEQLWSSQRWGGIGKGEA